MTQTTEMDQLNAQLVEAKALVENNESKAFEAWSLVKAAMREALMEARKNEIKSDNIIKKSEAEVTRIEAEIAALKAK
jgi:hypothetical protein